MVTQIWREAFLRIEIFSGVIYFFMTIWRNSTNTISPFSNLFSQCCNLNLNKGKGITFHVQFLKVCFYYFQLILFVDNMWPFQTILCLVQLVFLASTNIPLAFCGLIIWIWKGLSYLSSGQKYAFRYLLPRKILFFLYANYK